MRARCLDREGSMVPLGRSKRVAIRLDSLSSECIPHFLHPLKGSEGSAPGTNTTVNNDTGPNDLPYENLREIANKKSAYAFNSAWLGLESWNIPEDPPVAGLSAFTSTIGSTR